VAPEARNGAFEHFVAGPVINGSTFGTVLDIKACWALHVETDHMIVGVAAHGTREFYVRSDSPIVTTTHLVERIDLGHDMDATRRVGDFQKSKAVMPPVAVHEPKSLYGLIRIGCKPQLHQIRQAKSQGVGEETCGFIKVGRG